MIGRQLRNAPKGMSKTQRFVVRATSVRGYEVLLLHRLGAGSRGVLDGPHGRIIPLALRARLCQNLNVSRLVGSAGGRGDLLVLGNMRSWNFGKPRCEVGASQRDKQDPWDFGNPRDLTELYAIGNPEWLTALQGG